MEKVIGRDVGIEIQTGDKSENVEWERERQTDIEGEGEAGKQCERGRTESKQIMSQKPEMGEALSTSETI